MEKMIVFVLVIGGLWWYASKRFDFKDTLLVAKKYQSSPWAPGSVYRVGLVYYGRGDYEMAQQAFTQLLTDYPTGQYTARALLRMSEIAENTHDYESARQFLKRFLEEFPEHPDLRMAQKRMELLYNR